MKRAAKLFLVGWLIFSLLCVGAVKARADDVDADAKAIYLFLNIATIIKQYYVDEVRLRDIIYPAIKEMVDQLDPHSQFLTPEEVKKDREEEKATREYAGIGMMFGYRENLKSLKESAAENDIDVNGLTVEIKRVFDGSPAQRAGLLPKDEITAIDGVPIKDIGAAEVAKIKKFEKKAAEKSEQIRKKAVGPAGTKVILTVKRAGWDQPKDFVIIRDKIQLKNVEWKILESGGKKFGYLKIESFMPDTTAAEVKKAADEFKNRGVAGVIIDLRGNPGGRLDLCVRVLSVFLPSDALVITEKGKIGEEEIRIPENNPEHLSLPLVVLINENSASASEIVAGALRDHKKAVLIGKKSYGKGSVQNVMSFPDGSQLRLTIFKYFLPGGESIHEKGVPPHIEAETEFDEPIMNEALKALQNWKILQKKFLK